MLEITDRLIVEASESGYPAFRVWGKVFDDWARSHMFAEPEVLAEMNQSISDYKKVWGLFGVSTWQVLLADACLAQGEKQQALEALDEAEALIQKSGEHMMAPELHRLCGDIALANAREDKSDEAYRMAVESAREDMSKSLELRAATSLARLWQSQGKINEAHDLLAPVYDWFTEGFETADLKEAKALLDELK